jgi:hypothetical protein
MNSMQELVLLLSWEARLTSQKIAPGESLWGSMAASLRTFSEKQDSDERTSTSSMFRAKCFEEVSSLRLPALLFTQKFARYDALLETCLHLSLSLLEMRHLMQSSPNGPTLLETSTEVTSPALAESRTEEDTPSRPLSEQLWLPFTPPLSPATGAPGESSSPMT